MVMPAEAQLCWVTEKSQHLKISDTLKDALFYFLRE